MYVRVFYNNTLIHDLDKKRFRVFQASCPQEIYNSAYIYGTPYNNNLGWFRVDGTPVRLADVPKEIQLLNLLLN